MSKYNILWIDDEWESMTSFMKYCSLQYQMELYPFKTQTEGLDEAYQIGAAYFRKYLDYQDKTNPFDCLWENHLKGLLFEYLRGNRRAKELLEKLHDAYNKKSINE